MKNGLFRRKKYGCFCFQVLDWLQNHGEVFLRKNVGIGRNLQKAKAYQKSHETFEGVVQVRQKRICTAGVKKRMSCASAGETELGTLLGLSRLYCVMSSHSV